MNKTSLKTALHKWHRRSGLLVAPIIVMLVVTGIFINHSDDFGWSHKSLHSPIIASLYGIDSPNISHGFALNSDWLTQVDDALYFNQHVITPCTSKLNGAVVRTNDMALLCGDALLLLTSNGELIEKLTNLPTSSKNLDLQLGLRTLDTSIALQTEQKIWYLDESAGQWQLADKVASNTTSDITSNTTSDITSNATNNIAWNPSRALPQALAQTLNRQRPIPGITQERFLLDLHSGRLFGKIGVLMVDIAALFLLALAASGAYSVWLRQRSKKRKVRKS